MWHITDILTQALLGNKLKTFFHLDASVLEISACNLVISETQRFNSCIHLTTAKIYVQPSERPVSSF